MYIVQIASEIAPMAKIGGLADVMMGLSRELAKPELSKAGVKAVHHVDVCLPNYDCLDASSLRLSDEREAFQSYFEGQWHNNCVQQASYNGDFNVILFDSYHSRAFFRRGGIYGFQDDIDRFLYFSRAVLDWLKTKKKAPDIIHVHDWETAVIAALIKEPEFREHFKKTRVVFTIHNIEYQGWCLVKDIEKIGITSNHCTSLFVNDAINLMKCGIVLADYVTTVSPNYAKEVLTPEGGRGLEEVLRQNSHKFCGILNGIDTTFWDPYRDRYIAFPFSSTPHEDKLKNKHDLQMILGMQPDDSRPLITSIARLVPQKGIHLIEHAIKTARGRYQFVLLGSTQDPVVRAEFEALANELNKSADVRIILQIREDLAHKLYASSDICFVPSLFEPCGLVQLIALRYGTVPIVRKTGGLLDTIRDGENGFSFEYPNSGSVDWVLARALECWHDKERWNQLVQRSLQCDFSWKKPALEYLGVYKKVLS